MAEKESKTELNQRVERILEVLDREYGREYRCYLNHETPWQLLIAVIMSAQCTDARVNIVTADLFKKYDAVILPVGSGPAKLLDGSLDILDENTVILEEHLQIGNFGGFPSITIPDGFVDSLPVGLNITGNCYDDENVLNIAYALENTMEYKNQIAKEVNNG